jgi:hypothetical protein
MNTWRHLPIPARAVAVAACDAVAAAREQDRDGFATTTALLADVDGSGYVLGVVVRLLLEDLHPEGLAGDDIRAVIAGCTVDAAWWPSHDPHVTLVLLAGALGVYEPGDAIDPPTAVQFAEHAPLLLAHLLAAAGTAFEPYVTAAFAEIQRTELHDG